MRSISFVLALLILAGCGPAVVTVTVTAASATPKVGQTDQVTATPKDAAGNAIAGISCVFASSDETAATVDGTGLVTALAPGATAITATCAGKSGSVPLQVLTNQYTLTVAIQGDGAGIVSPSPAGPSYDPGTPVTLTATATSGTFVGWSGGSCSGSASTCDITIDADATVTATFGLHTYSGAYSASLGNVTGLAGCNWSVSASGTLTLNVAELSGGTLTGLSASQPYIDIAVLSGGCTSTPFTISDAMGSLSGSKSSMTTTLSSATNTYFTMQFDGALDAGTITGSALLQDTLHDSNGNGYPVSGNTGDFTLN